MSGDNLIEDVKKKRGRRKKSEIIQDNIQIVLEEVTDKKSLYEHVIKKRGRKPKGGKLTLKKPEKTNEQPSIANIILHLKCSMNDLNDYNSKINKLVKNPLEYNPSVPPDIMTYNDKKTIPFGVYDETITTTKPENNNDTNVFDKIGSFTYAYNDSNIANNPNIKTLCSLCAANMNPLSSNNIKSEIMNEIEKKTEDEEDDDGVSIKDINTKLKKLKINLYKNINPDKKTACFWCTYGYDNPPCYIPKYEMDEKIYGYGSFCRPECAVAFLMKENIDDSTKFERYHLLNQIYSKVYNFKKNIKPAPNPYYLLDKFCGNLSIQEYRKLLKTEHMLLVIDKPLTRILPELHEDNEEIMINIFGGGNKPLNNNSNTTGNSNNTGIYKVKRQTDKNAVPSKSSIMRDKFGIS
jgi:hypothetical protein